MGRTPESNLGGGECARCVPSSQSAHLYFLCARVPSSGVELISLGRDAPIICYFVDGEERKTQTRILEEPAQPSFIPSANSYRLFLLQVHGRTHFFEFLCATSNNCDSGSLRFGLYVRRGDGVMSMGKRENPTRILEEPAQPSFLPSASSYRLFLLNIFRV